MAVLGQQNRTVYYSLPLLMHLDLWWREGAKGRRVYFMHPSPPAFLPPISNTKVLSAASCYQAPSSSKQRASERTLARIFHSISYRPFYFSPLSITPSIKTLALNCSLTPMHRTSAPEERNHQQKTLRHHRQHPQVTKRQARAQDSAPQQRHVASQTCPCVAHNQHANTAEHLQARSEGLDG